MSNLLRTLTVAGALAAPLAATAAAPAKAPLPTLSEVLAASGITEAGYIDVSFGYKNTAAGTFSGDVFNTNRDSFDLHQVGLTLSKLPAEGFGGLVNVIAGSDAAVLVSAGSNGGGNFDVTQAFVSYATGALTLIGGKYLTASGAEVIDPTGDVNLSRSILFGYAIPFTHTGVRATYKFGDVVSVFGGINNGWDQQKDGNVQKTGELGLVFCPGTSFGLTAVAYSGSEPGAFVAGTPTNNGNRSVVDVVATINATDKLSFVLNGDFAKQVDAIAAGSDASWSGEAAYVNLKMSGQWRLSLRGENFNDKNGFKTGAAQKLKEGTLTLGYAPASNFDLLAEVRADKSDTATFTDPDGTSKKSQASVGLKALYKF